MSVKERKSILSKVTTAALDRSKVTDRQAVHLLGTTAHTLGHKVDEVTLSSSSIQHAQFSNREHET